MKNVVQDLTSAGIDWQREKWQSGLGSKFIHQGEKNAAKYADEVIVLSKGVQDYFKETYGRETHFIPNGVNRPQIREASLITDKFGLKKDSYILFLGRLVPEKGIRYLVEAFKNVKTDKKLVIAGGSSDTDSFMEELKELAKGDDRILFTGFVQGAMLDELYSNAYIYTLPSDLEGMPLSLLEAMSYGNCCLVSDIPECAEVVEDKALIFKKSDVEDLREKLQDACDHPEMVMKMKKQAADFMYFVVIAIAAVVLVGIVLLSPIKEKFISASSRTEIGIDPLAAFTSGRSTFWTYDILTMIKNKPIRILFGNGVNYLFKINYAHFGNPLWAHNDFIQIFSDYGLFGLLVYLGMFITLFKKTFNGIKISKMAMMMLVAIWAFNAFFNMFYTYFCATLSYPFYCMIIKIDAIKRGGGNPKQMD